MIGQKKEIMLLLYNFISGEPNTKILEIQKFNFPNSHLYSALLEIKFQEVNLKYSTNQNAP